MTRAGMALGCAAASMGASAATATFQIDVQGCSIFGSSGSCAGFKPSSFQATWTYDENAPAAAVSSSVNSQGNTVTGSSLKLSATLASPYGTAAQQMADMGVQASAVTSQGLVTSTRTTTPSGALVADPYGAYTARLEQQGDNASFANGVSTTQSYMSSLSAYLAPGTVVSAVSGATMQTFLETAPYWSFNSIALVSTYANGVSSYGEQDLYGIARVVSLSAVPEPATAGLLLAGLAGVAGAARRRKARAL
ncbi:PEP-CTERM sorting domain-containing protein [Xylophilus rhododendri]|uniref:PEP-CTERM sorting domain-containing protein n=1 Tax=Xylophilus rhododendri TaxID=2697032 RepID=A0A857JE62_9BURK|nr:PEP-CTERM sorting domain-containing protein [Xylophilus rhododendri]QHJ01069.1 PEP-CTERM sorting domain-containing protein [Xylophilus rhododendri]